VSSDTKRARRVKGKFNWTQFGRGKCTLAYTLECSRGTFNLNSLYLIPRHLHVFLSMRLQKLSKVCKGQSSNGVRLRKLSKVVASHGMGDQNYYLSSEYFWTLSRWSCYFYPPETNIHTYIALTLYPRRGSRGVSVLLRDSIVLPKLVDWLGTWAGVIWRKSIANKKKKKKILNI
jgi:hypothetical protein